MRLSLIAVFAVAALALAANSASACNSLGCGDFAVGDDMYPPGDPTLHPDVERAVEARSGYGLATAGFYNDPDLAMAGLALPPPPGGWGEPARVEGPAVVYSSWGPNAHGHYARQRRYAHAHAY